MTRIFWIIGLSITVLMFAVMAITCLAGLIMRRHLNLNLWMMLISFSYGAYFMFGRLRAAIRHGDPTKGLDV